MHQYTQSYKENNAFYSIGVLTIIIIIIFNLLSRCTVLLEKKYVFIDI